jgi:hypothetical protein
MFKPPTQDPAKTLRHNVGNTPSAQATVPFVCDPNGSPGGDDLIRQHILQQTVPSVCHAF